MKHLLYLFIIVSLFSCNKREDTKPKAFQKIPYNRSYDYRDSLVKKFIPNTKYDYWEYIAVHTSYNAERNYDYDIVRFGGDTTFRKKLKEQSELLGFFSGGHPGWRIKQVAVVENGKPDYLLTADQVKPFLGTIDNLEEALYLALLSGYQLDSSDLRGSGYKITETGYEMHLMKFHEYPSRYESVEVFITKEGFMRTRSLGIYCKGYNCH